MLNENFCPLTGRLCANNCPMHYEDADGGNRCGFASFLEAATKLANIEAGEILRRQKIRQLTDLSKTKYENDRISG